MKNLRTIVLGSIASAVLLLSGCPPPSPEKPKTTNPIEDASKKALDDYNRLFSEMTGANYATGNVAKEPVQNQEVKESPKAVKEQVQQQPVKDIPRPPRNLEDYFLKGEELNGLELVSGNWRGHATGQLYSPKELSDIKEDLSTKLFHSDALKKMGMIFYTFSGGKDSTHLIQTVCEFNTELENWEFLNEFINDNDMLLFVNKNISSMIYFGDMSFTEDISKKIEQEKTLMDSLIKYEKRTLGDFYSGNKNNWKDLENIYKKLGISVSESGTYFKEAMEFQRKLYDVKNEEQLYDIISKENDFNLLKEKINSLKWPLGEDITKEQEREFLLIGENIKKKFFFILPRFERTYSNFFQINPSEQLGKMVTQVGSFKEFEDSILSSRKKLEIGLYFSLSNNYSPYVMTNEIKQNLGFLYLSYNAQARKQLSDEVEKQRRLNQ